MVEIIIKMAENDFSRNISVAVTSALPQVNSFGSDLAAVTRNAGKNNDNQVQLSVGY